MKNRAIAALLAIFLGSFGIHKFYLGQNIAGVIYFLFSWTFIPGIVAFFEFLGFIFMSDAAFDARYNPNYNLQNMRASYQDTVSAIGELKRLYEMGAITPEEYEDKRRKLLDSI